MGVTIRAGNLRELFETACQAMFDQIVDRRNLKGRDKIQLRVTGIDLSDLMINWLRELLFLWNGHQYLVKQARVVHIEEKALNARIAYDPYNPGIHEVLTDIKAVTYHGIDVREAGAWWQATVIFDV